MQVLKMFQSALENNSVSVCHFGGNSKKTLENFSA